MKQKKIENYYQLNSLIIPVIMLILLGIGLFAATRLTGLRQILKSRASLDRGAIELGTNKTTIIGQEFEIPVVLSLKGQEIVAVDVVLSFDNNSLELTDITLKPDSANNKLTTYLPKDSNNGFNKAKVLQTASSTGKIEFSAVCFSATGCPQGQSQDLKETNPLAILKFKTLKTGDTAVNVLYSPGKTNNSNLITRAKEQIISNSTPLSIKVTSNTPVTTTPPTVFIPTTYSISGTMYVSSGPYTGGFSVGSSEGGNVSNGSSSGKYSVTNLPLTPSNGSYYQLTFSIPSGYRVIGSDLAGWSCGGAQGVACSGTLYGSVTLDSLKKSPNLTNVNIALEQLPITQVPTPAPAPLVVSLTNPSFENWSSGRGSGDNSVCNNGNPGCNAAPDNWTPEGTLYRMYASEGRNGGSSVERDAQPFYQDITVAPNTNYTLGGWVKPYTLWWRTNQGEAELWGIKKENMMAKLCAKAPSGSELSCATTQGQVDDPWIQLQTSFNSGNNTTIRIWAYNNIPQTTLWDDFSIQTQ